MDRKTQIQNNIIAQLEEERIRQDEKWGEQNHHPLYWMNILMEEVGEASQAVLQERYSEYRDEMLQVMAVAMAAIESYDRMKNVKVLTSEIEKHFPEAEESY